MIRRLAIVAACILMPWATSGQQLDRDWTAFTKRYLPTDLATLLGRAKGIVARQAVDRLFIPAATQERFRFCATYTGIVRPIPGSRRAFLRDSMKAIQADQALADLYDQDILVRDAKVEHWFPVQRQMATSLQQEVRVGSALQLYVAWYGAVAQDVVFDVEEFGPECVK